MKKNQKLLYLSIKFFIPQTRDIAKRYCRYFVVVGVCHQSKWMLLTHFQINEGWKSKSEVISEADRK